MSRTNPYKKKRRSASRTLLMYGEGLGEEMFLKYLRGLYARNSGVSVIIRNGKGGNACDIVSSAMNEPGDFNRRVVILDNDKDQEEMSKARVKAKQKGIEILENCPCLEAMLLSILQEGKSFSNKTSAWCKNEFEKDYLDKKKRTDFNEYPRIFPKEMIDKQRKNIIELSTIISLMEK